MRFDEDGTRIGLNAIYQLSECTCGEGVSPRLRGGSEPMAAGRE